MKTFYHLLTNQLYSLTDLKDSKQILNSDNEIGFKIIHFLKSLNKSFFDKIILFVLKQNFNIPEFKEKLSIIINRNYSIEGDNKVVE